MSRLGWTQEMIAEVVGLSRNRASEIVGNANFGEIDTLLSQGHDMEYIAQHYHMDLALAWALRLEGMTDQEKFRKLGRGLRKFSIDSGLFTNSVSSIKSRTSFAGMTCKRQYIEYIRHSGESRNPDILS